MDVSSRKLAERIRNLEKRVFSGTTGGSSVRPPNEIDVGNLASVIESDTKPEVFVGKLWLNGDGTLHVGVETESGNQWQPVPPIQETQEVVDFEESYITATTIDNLRLLNGSYALANIVGDVVDIPDFVNDGPGYYGESGLSLTLSSDFPNGLHARLYADPSSEFNEFRLYEDGAIVETVAADGTFAAGDWVEFDSSLSQKSDYKITAEYGAGGGPYFSTSDFPKSGTNLKIDSGWEDGSDSPTRAHIFDAVQGQGGDPASGSVTFEFDQTPDDISAWDVAAHRYTDEGETVNVYVEESTDGGATWDRLNNGTHISSPQDISTVDPDSEVRFVVEITRNDMSNTPSIDYLARRFLR